jgi:hypothetical protein
MKYKVMDFYTAEIATPEEWEEKLNTLGAEGWVVITSATVKGRTRIVFQREEAA